MWGVCVYEVNRWRKWTKNTDEGQTQTKKRMKENLKTIQLTLWSFSGGRTIVLSMVFSTIFHSSFKTRFSTVFSQILANSIKLQERAFVSPTAENTHTELAWRKTSSRHQREKHLWFTKKRQPWRVNLTIVQHLRRKKRQEGFCYYYFFYISLRGFPLIPHWPGYCFDELFWEIPSSEEWNISCATEGSIFSWIHWHSQLMTACKPNRKW